MCMVHKIQEKNFLRKWCCKPSTFQSIYFSNKINNHAGFHWLVFMFALFGIACITSFKNGYSSMYHPCTWSAQKLSCVKFSVNMTWIHATWSISFQRFIFFSTYIFSVLAWKLPEKMSYLTTWWRIFGSGALTGQSPPPVTKAYISFRWVCILTCIFFRNSVWSPILSPVGDWRNKLVLLDHAAMCHSYWYIWQAMGMCIISGGVWKVAWLSYHGQVGCSEFAVLI